MGQTPACSEIPAGLPCPPTRWPWASWPPGRAPPPRTNIQLSPPSAPYPYNIRGRQKLPRCLRPLRERVQRSVAALGWREPPALGCDRAALHAIRVVDDHVDLAVGRGVIGNLVHAGWAHPLP